MLLWFCGEWCRVWLSRAVLVLCLRVWGGVAARRQANGDSASNQVRNAVPPEPSGPGHSHSRRTKSVIRAEGLFPARLVTGEFYAWVTAGNVTPRRVAPKAIRDKRPVGRWLRSSRDNCADQGSIVIESLSKFSARSEAVNRR